MVEKIEFQGELYAMIIRSNFKKEGIEFFTPNHFSQQLGYMNHKKGYKIEPHVHLQVVKQTTFTQEVLFIKSGKVRVDFYTQDMTYFVSEILEQGDVILLATGGHGFEILEPCEMIEVKQGPYNADVDKKRFSSDPNVVIKMHSGNR